MLTYVNVVIHNNKTRAPIANPPNSAQLGVPLPFPQVTSRSV